MILSGKFGFKIGLILLRYLCNCALVFLLFIQSANAQEFKFVGKKSKTSIGIQVIGNLIFVPATVNDVQLTFLVDTGVDETILFSLDESQELQLNNVQKVQLRGLGAAGSVDGLRSTQNVVSIGKLTDTSHEIYIILDGDINFSSHVGIPVNGIMGYELFKNLIVEVNYDKQKIVFYDTISKVRGIKNKQVTKLPISIEQHKPYINAKVSQVQLQDVKLLIDTGNSDAVWLFNTAKIAISSTNFKDYLGRGFSGDIYGKRARIDEFALADFNFKQPLVAFPDSLSTRNIKMVENRSGSLGGEILKRFRVIFDYAGNNLYLHKGNNFDSDFKYNMSGMEVHHNGVQWIKETVPMKTKLNGVAYDGLGDVIRNDFNYKFELKPVYAVSGVRENSPAAIAGLLTDDIIIKINGVQAHRYSLSDINTLLKSVEGKKIQMEVERNGKFISATFYLKNIL